MSQSATIDRAAVHPVIPKADAIRFLSAQLEEGMQVRHLRIKTAAALDSARELKLRWCQRTTDFLTQIYGESNIAEEVFAWVGRIIPEYAELDLFVEQFHEEMDQHLHRVRSLVKSLQRAPDAPARPLTPPAQQHAAPLPSQAYLATPAQDLCSLDDLELDPFVNPRPAKAAAPAPTPAPAPVPNPVPAKTESLHPPTRKPPVPKPQIAKTPAKAQAAKAPAAKPAPAPQIQQEKKMSSGMLIVHGDCGDAINHVHGFFKPLGLALVSPPSSPDQTQPVIASLGEHKDLDFALVVDSDQPTQCAPAAAPENQPGPDGQPAPESQSAPAADVAFNENNGMAFELGFCVGRLGVGRVFVLHPQATQSYTDRHGVVHLPIDPTGGWQLQLARHLKRGGIDVDLNKLC